MTLNVALGASPAAPHARPADRPQKSVISDGPAFDEALSDRNARRKEEETSTSESAEKPRIDLSYCLLTERIAPDLDQASDAIPNPEADFDAVIEQFLELAPDTEHPTTALLPPQPSALSGTIAEDVSASTAPDGSQVEDDNVARPSAGEAIAPSVSASRAQETNSRANVVPTPSQTQEPDKRRSTERVVADGPRANPSAASAQRQQPPDRVATPHEELATRHPLEANRAEEAPQRNPGRGLPDAPKVNVLSFNTSLPPVSPMNAGPTVTGLVNAMEADVTWRSAALDSAQNSENRQPNSQSGVNTLRIQLNPAELGVVTARLTATGQQLEVEIRVETTEARQKLNADSETILKALRSIGYDVERVTITQSSANTSGNSQNGASARDQSFQNTQSQSDSHAQNRGKSDDQESGNHSTTARASGEIASSHAGGDLYI